MPKSLLRILPAQLWADAGASARSRELTPLYVDRYAGPRRPAERSGHSYWELTYVYGGAGWMATDAGCTPLARHSAVLIPPGLAHAEQTDQTLDCLWVGLAGDRLDGLSRERLLVASGPDLLPLCDQLWQRAGRSYDSGGPELDGLTAVVLGRFLRYLAEGTDDVADRIGAAVAWIRQNFQDSTSVPDLARRCGCSESHFHREFRRRTGRSPVDFLTAVRVEQAMKWLRNSSLTVGEVARLAGFANAFYFSRVFRRATGMPPGRWRQQPAEEP